VRFNHIVCPIDFGPSSLQGLSYALSLAEEAGGRLTVLHVVEVLPAPGEPALPELVDYGRGLQSKAEERLRAAIPAEARDWCQPVEMVCGGKSSDQILRVAHDTNAELIVMGVAGRNAAHLWFFGSTTNHVVRRAGCPVLTVREKA
jgi:nucleotide-binding universal stress UspA family protein